MTNILNWPDYKVLQVSELEHDYQVHAEVSEPPTHCPHCNHPEIVGFGRRDEVVMDTPVHGKRTGIMLNRRRYRCQSCRKTFLEPVPHKDDKRQMTHRLIQYIERESLRRTFSGVAEDVGVDEKPSATYSAITASVWKRRSNSRCRNGWALTKSTSSSPAA